MTVYSVTYDLNGENKNYDKLIEELESCSKSVHYQKSAWLVKTNETSEELCNRLLKKIDSDDSLFVIEVNRIYFGRLEEDHWNPIHALFD